MEFVNNSDIYYIDPLETKIDYYPTYTPPQHLKNIRDEDTGYDDFKITLLNHIQDLYFNLISPNYTFNNITTIYITIYNPILTISGDFEKIVIPLSFSIALLSIILSSLN